MLDAKRVSAVIVVLLVFTALWFFNRQDVQEMSSTPTPTIEAPQVASNPDPDDTLDLEPTPPPVAEESSDEEMPVEDIAPATPEPEPMIAEDPPEIAENISPEEDPTAEATVKGRVYDLTDDRGLADVEVSVVPSEGGVTAQHTTRTDASGNYTLRVIGEGRYRIRTGEVAGFPQTSRSRVIQSFEVSSASSSDIT